jgi:D-alanine--poly(phosphoribitol) ligase subunit 2
MNYEETSKIVFDALSEVLSMKDQNDIKITDETTLFGIGSVIDSLDLVNLIVRVEETLQEQIGKKVTIVDENSVMSKNSPLKNIKSLSNLILTKLNEQ